MECWERPDIPPHHSNTPSLHLPISSSFCVFLVTVGDFGLLLVAFVEVKAIAECDALPGRNRDIAGAGGFSLKIMHPERIRGEQAVIAHMPPGGVLGVLRVIENRDADSFILHRAVVIAPGGPLAPGFVIPYSGAQDDMALDRKSVV